MKEGISEKWTEFSNWWDDTGFSNWWNNKVKPKFESDKWSGSSTDGMRAGLKAKWEEFSTWWNDTGFKNWWDNNVASKFTKENWTFSGIKDGLSAAWDNAIAAIKQIWNKFATWMNDKLTFKWDSKSIGGKEIISAGSIKLGTLPTFATGGFPEDGLFMANHNELVGKFSNGKTAVANNQQITEGIRQAAYLGMKQALAEAGGNNNNVTFQIEPDPNGIFKVVKKEAEIYRNATGRPAFDY